MKALDRLTHAVAATRPNQESDGSEQVCQTKRNQSPELQKTQNTKTRGEPSSIL